MGGKGKKLAVAKKLSQKCVKTSKTTRDKREERETKLRLRKEQARNYECKEEKEFAAELLDKGLVISIVEGDGNCMFRSISDQLHGTVDHHTEIRQNIVDYMVEHSAHFSLFMEDDESFGDYAARMRTSGEWGGHQELYACSCCYNASLYVYQFQTPRWVLPSPDNLDTSSAGVINLSYHGEHHYNSLHTSTSIGKKIDVSVHPPPRSSSKKKETSTEEKRLRLVKTLPWLNASDATASLEACGDQFSLAVEYAVQHFFSAEGTKDRELCSAEHGACGYGEDDSCDMVEESELQEVVRNNASTAAPRHSDNTTEATRSRSVTVKQEKVKPPKGLSKKEKRLFKKDRHVGAVRGIRSGEVDILTAETTLAASVEDIIL